MEERKFDRTWNAERVLKTFLNYANEDGFLVDMSSYEESPYKIGQRRLLAALKAYGRDEICFYNSHPESPFPSHNACLFLISSTRSQKKMDEFRDIIRQSISATPVYERLLSDSFINEADIKLAFEKLFEFRKGIFALEHQWSGVLECSPSLGLIYRATNMLYSTHIRKACGIIDTMLILLMGDDFDKTFTEEELFEYGYPDVTDKELYEMNMDW